MLKQNELTDSQIKRRQQIFDAAENLFERYGFKKTTILDLCKAAGLSKPTFYKYFKNKEYLFVHLMIHITETSIEKWESRLPESINPVKKLLSFIDFIGEFSADKPIFRMIYEDPSAMEKFAWIIYKTPHSPILSSLRRILQDGVKTQQFRNLNPDAVLWMIYAILDSMYVLVPLMTGETGAGDNPVLAREVKQFILKGIETCSE